MPVDSELGGHFLESQSRRLPPLGVLVYLFLQIKRVPAATALARGLYSSLEVVFRHRMSPAITFAEGGQLLTTG